MANRKKDNIIQGTPGDGFVDDATFQNSIRRHVEAFGFSDAVGNIVECYRCQARRYNKEADRLEKQMKKGAPK